MSNIHRIKWLDEKIRNNAYPNSKNISEKFEISNRQALRDIEYLKCSLNAPIEYCYKNRGYYYTEAAYVIPNEMISESDRKLLTNIISCYKGKNHTEAIKLKTIFSNEDSKRDEEHILEVLRIAINKNLKIELDTEIENIVGKVIPIKLKFPKWENVLTIRFDNSDIVKDISINNITSVKLLKEKFNPNNPRHEGVNIRELYNATLEFNGDINLSDYPYGIKVMGKYTTLEFKESNRLISYLFSKNCDFKIVEPKWLRAKLVRKIEKIIKNNLP